MRYKVLIILSLCSIYIYAQKESKSVKEGNKLYEAQKFTEAQKKYEEGISRNADSYSANFNLGNALYRQKKFKITKIGRASCRERV